MAEPFKNLLNAELVIATGRHLKRSWRGFDARAFEERVLPGFDALEMKARALRIADGLEQTLPSDFDQACGVIEAALAPPDAGHGEGIASVPISAAGLAGWVVWPLGEFVARRGLATPDRALEALQALTQRFSSEFAIRPLIAAHPDLCFQTLQRWTTHPNTHVRRLVSEGSRPRLPWGLQLKQLVRDPSPALPLLEALQDDPMPYVRRSVANHLNDIAKDHPAVVVDWVQRHQPGASHERKALLMHASRTLVKQGHAPMLALWGAVASFEGQAELSLSPRRLCIGDAVTLQVALHSTSAKDQRLVIDLVLLSPTAVRSSGRQDAPPASGGSNTKVFKGWTLDLPGNARIDLTRALSMKPVTTRRVAPGRHHLLLRINGVDQPSQAFELTAAG